MYLDDVEKLLAGDVTSRQIMAENSYESIDILEGKISIKKGRSRQYKNYNFSCSSHLENEVENFASYPGIILPLMGMTLYNYMRCESMTVLLYLSCISSYLKTVHIPFKCPEIFYVIAIVLLCISIT